jgi:neutral trehalase
MPVVSPDLNTYLVLQMQALSRMAAILGLAGEAESWQVKSTAHAGKMITALWDDQKGYFNALHNGQTRSRSDPFTFTLFGQRACRRKFRPNAQPI